ncbi:MAG: DUF5076 domain-containing protein [Myxococcaceae bacterium]
MNDGFLGDPPRVGFALQPPALSEANPTSLEFLRAWVSGEQVAVQLREDLWMDPAAWGVALVDVAVAAARSYGQKGLPVQVALARIREGLDAEWEVASTGPDRTPVALSPKARERLPSARSRPKPVRRRAPRGGR